MTRDELATLDIYRQADSQYRNSKDANIRREATALMVKASKHELSHPLVGQSPLEMVVDSLRLDAKACEQDGNLDAALERYLAAIRVCQQIRQTDLTGSEWHFADSMEVSTLSYLSSWAARPGQTVDRIMDAQRQLRPSTPHWPHPLPPGPIERQYAFLHRVLNGGPPVVENASGNSYCSLPTLTAIWLHLPWERARAIRLLNLQTRFELGGGSGRDGQAIQGGPDWDDLRRTVISLAPLKDSELLDALRNYCQLPPLSDRWDQDHGWRRVPTVRENQRAVDTARNAARIVLALETYKLQHGSLPKSLDALVGPHLDQVPPDPYSFEPFRYFREGLKIPLRYHLPLWGWPATVADGEIPADVPLIWSTGPVVKVNHSSDSEENVFHKYWIELPWPYGNRYRYGGTRQPTSEYDVWSAGWPFAIPQPASGDVKHSPAR